MYFVVNKKQVQPESYPLKLLLSFYWIRAYQRFPVLAEIKDKLWC